jgi:hypothetical protein
MLRPDKCLVVSSISPELRPDCPHNTGANPATTKKGGRHLLAIAEIESAIERLSLAEVKQSAAWFEEYQQMVNASAEIFSLYDQEEKAGT